jgi:copper chaperone
VNTSNEITLTIDGMSCGHCVAAVKRALATVPGVSDAVVSVGAARVTVSAGSREEVVAHAIRAIQQAGYDSSPAMFGAAAAGLAPTSCCSAPTARPGALS